MRTLWVMVSCLACSSTALAGVGHSKGIVLYWHCDDDAGFGWRDNHWQKGGSPNVTYDSKQRIHGKAALRIEGMQGQELHVMSLTRPAPVEPDERYVLRFWARTEGITERAEVRVLAHGPRRPEKTYAPLGWVRLSPKVHYVLPADHDWRRHEAAIERLKLCMEADTWPSGYAEIRVFDLI